MDSNIQRRFPLPRSQEEIRHCQLTRARQGELPITGMQGLIVLALVILFFLLGPRGEAGAYISLTLVGALALPLHYYWKQTFRKRNRQVSEIIQSCLYDGKIWDVRQQQLLIRRVFKEFWQAVATLNVSAIREISTPALAEETESVLTEWTKNNWFPNMHYITFESAHLLGLHTNGQDQNDRFCVWIKGSSNFHLIDHTSWEAIWGWETTKESLNGSPANGQTWHFLRSGDAWLLDRIESTLQNLALKTTAVAFGTANAD